MPGVEDLEEAVDALNIGGDSQDVWPKGREGEAIGVEVAAGAAQLLSSERFILLISSDWRRGRGGGFIG